VVLLLYSGVILQQETIEGLDAGGWRNAPTHSAAVLMESVI
jgi:hypothetical protein